MTHNDSQQQPEQFAFEAVGHVPNQPQTTNESEQTMSTNPTITGSHNEHGDAVYRVEHSDGQFIVFRNESLRRADGSDHLFVDDVSNGYADWGHDSDDDRQNVANTIAAALGGIATEPVAEPPSERELSLAETIDATQSELAAERDRALEKALRSIEYLRQSLDNAADELEKSRAGNPASSTSFVPSHQRLVECVEATSEYRALWNATGLAKLIADQTNS